MNTNTLKIMLILCATSLTGCSGQSADGNSSTTKAGAAKSIGWNAADACSILDKAVVAAALKREVPSTQLGLVHEADGSAAATSECAYLGADGASVARLMTRWSPINDNTPDAIATARSAAAAAMKPFSSVPIEDISGLGTAAFLAPPINQLNVFIDNARMITVTVEKLPDSASGKDTAVALAKKAGA